MQFLGPNRAPTRDRYDRTHSTDPRTPLLYELYHSLISANYRSRVLVSRYIRPKPHDRILDIGCGPGNMLPFLPECQYLGVDANPTYIASARQQPARLLGLWRGGAGADDRLRTGGRGVGPGCGASLDLRGVERTTASFGGFTGCSVCESLWLQAAALPI